MGNWDTEEGEIDGGKEEGKGSEGGALQPWDKGGLRALPHARTEVGERGVR